MSSRSNIYLNYLASEHWAFLKRQCFSLAEHRCEVCADTRLLVGHHIIYREPLTACIADDIMCLCETCHNALHRWLACKGKKSSDYDRLQTRSIILRIRSGGNPPPEITKPIPLLDTRRQVVFEKPVITNGLGLFELAQRTLSDANFRMFTLQCGAKIGMGKGKWNHAVKLLQKKSGLSLKYLKDCPKGKKAREGMMQK